jgi:hypothetical protein
MINIKKMASAMAEIENTPVVVENAVGTGGKDHTKELT